MALMSMTSRPFSSTGSGRICWAHFADPGRFLLGDQMTNRNRILAAAGDAASVVCPPNSRRLRWLSPRVFHSRCTGTTVSWLGGFDGFAPLLLIVLCLGGRIASYRRASGRDDGKLRPRE